MVTHSKCEQRKQIRKPAKLTDIFNMFSIHITYILNQTSSSHFRLNQDIEMRGNIMPTK